MGVSPTPNFWRQRRVLLTGHTGFKGSWLCLWLQQLGASLHGLGLPPERQTSTTPALFETLDLANSLGPEHHHLLDIRNAEAVVELVRRAQPEIVFHLAAQPLVRLSYQQPEQTWSTNVQGTLHLLQALRQLNHPCAVVLISTDKVYANQNWDWGYRETDHLGGHDPYSASKAAMELLAASWRSSFCGPQPHQTPHLTIATARAGNVLGGGDWAADRIMPDAMRALAAGEPIPLRNPAATRPWQHVLEPLGGYLLLAERLFNEGPQLASAFNFGPTLNSNRSVRELIEEALLHWPGSWLDRSNPQAPHEAERLHLQIDKAHHQLGWRPRWPFATTVARTVAWYRAVHEGASPRACCLADLAAYQQAGSDAH